MKGRLVKLAVGIAVVLILAAVLHVLAQPGPPGGAPGGPFPEMMMPGWPPAPTPVVVVADGVVYVACDGKLTAFEAKTLQVLGEAIYWEREEPLQ
jgi:outer membrane protein assembly factor BamB